MRKSGSMFGILVAISLIALGFGSPARADTKAEITEMEHKFAATTSVDEAMAYFTPSGTL